MTKDPSPTDAAMINEWGRWLRHRGRPAGTVKTWRTPPTRVARELPEGLLAWPEELEEWVGTIHATLARNTAISYIVALKSFYGWAVKSGRWRGDDPTVDIPIPTRRPGMPRPVPAAELAVILTQAREPVRTWCILAARAGLRCCEIARLTREDITPEAVYIHGKGDKHRVVPTHPDIWVATRSLLSGPVAAGLTAARVSDRVAWECDRLGLPDVTAHRLRHTAGTAWQRAIRDIRVTQRLLGHASPATTAVYADVADEDMRAAVMAVPALSPR